MALEMLCFLEPAVTDGTLSQDHDETRETARAREMKLGSQRMSHSSSKSVKVQNTTKIVKKKQ